MEDEKIIIVDVSSWDDAPTINRQVNFWKMKEAGARGAIIRFGHDDFTDHSAMLNYELALSAGLWVGAYWWLGWKTNHIDQMKRFAAMLRFTAGLDFPPIIDFESPKPLAARWKPSDKLREALEYLEGRIATEGNTLPPMIYTSPGFWGSYGTKDIAWARYPLWLAHYRVAKPRIPAPWTDYAIWQYDDRGDGLKYGQQSKQADMNLYNPADCFGLLKQEAE